MLMTVCAHRWVWNVWTVCGIHINKFRWSDNFSVYVAYAFGRCMAALTLYGSLFFCFKSVRKADENDTTYSTELK